MTEIPPPQPGIKRLVREAVWRLFADEAMPLAGNIAFRTLFSVFPFLIFLTALAGFFGNEALADQAITYLLSVAPPELAGPLGPEIHSILTVPRSGLLSLSVLATIWSAMGGVDSIRVGLNRAYDLKETRHLGWVYLISVLFIVGTAFVMIVLALLILFAPVLIALVQRLAPELAGVSRLFDILRVPAAILVLFVGLIAAHKVLPAHRASLRTILPGVLLTMSVWMLLSIAYSAYFANFPSFASTYAGLSGLFAAMFFLYLAALVLIFGGEINRVLAIYREASERKAADLGER